ncbi:Protein-tyrosine-phosphatase MKP1 [Capsicum annuum]|uniref:Protein-tyrosine-phosphatase MKP1 n=1 Tax=Capsicum annuum TaxID=4072 RepID=A0A2G2YRQ7_CAPAN|nr:Protein-tyrosine-phosphatase MKP1 [Capsicum annuum]KAF3678265.1 Protein-tyrosine-phosphatase MKP1 [Capsicum annuum]PHT72430.1 Protein-tyrosine-phosphatase MKP1 [Capsicum annuum]
MFEKEDASADGADGSQEPSQLANSGRMLRLPPLQPLAIARRSLGEWLRSGSDDIGEWPLPSTPSGRDMNSNSERLKMDLLNIHKNPEINGRLVRREKIAFFNKECSKVAEHVFLGGDAVATDRDILKKNGITHVLNCVGFVCPEYFKSDFVYQVLWLHDSLSEDITSILYDVFDYFKDVREKHGRVFVHCYQGVSRSTSLVIAHLMWREEQSFDDAFEYVKETRSIVDPNIGFAYQLLKCQKRVHALPLSPDCIVERAIQVCLDDVQETAPPPMIAPPPIVNTYPLVDFTSFDPVILFASLTPSSSTENLL